MEPIRDDDLWRRIDRALEFHTVECCVWQVAEAPDRKSHRTATSPGWSIAAALGKLRRGVFTPLSTLWRPTFTRAA
jgi:hypothetical protein